MDHNMDNGGRFGGYMCGNYYCMVHVIKEGDTLYKLSREYGVKVSALMMANPFVDIYNLRIGDEVCIPRLRKPEQMQQQPQSMPSQPGQMQPQPRTMPSRMQAMPSQMQSSMPSQQAMPSQWAMPSQMQEMPSQMQEMPSQWAMPSQMQEMPSQPETMPSQMQPQMPGNQDEEACMTDAGRKFSEHESSRNGINYPAEDDTY